MILSSQSSVLRKPCAKACMMSWLMLCWLLGVGAMSVGQAADANALAKQADTELRSAERDFFNGKPESADAKLSQVDKILEELRKADASHRNLKSLDAKHQKLRKDVDRRLGKTEPARSTPVPPAARPATPSTRPAVSSTDAARMNRDLQKAVRDVDYSLGLLETLMSEAGVVGASQAIEQRQKQAEKYLADASGYLAKLEEKYGEQLPAPSPELDACRTKIAEAGKKAEVWVAQLREKAAADATTQEQANRSAAEKLAEAEADAARMQALYEQYHEALAPIHGNSLVYGIELKDAQKALEKIETVEKQVLPKLATELGRLADKYGKDAMTINNRLFEMGLKSQGDPGGRLATLIAAVGNVSASRRASAESLVQKAETLLSAFSSELNDVRIQRMNDAKALLVVGQQLDSTNKQIQEKLSAIDDQIADVAERMEKEINARTWAGNLDSFAGPGEVQSLSKAALEYFRKDKDWGANPDRKIEVLAVCVRGPWKVAERDVFGRVIRWRLPIHTAITDEKLRPRKLVRVYELSIVAQEGAPDKAPQAPPFDGYWVGNSWMMRPDKL